MSHDSYMRASHDQYWTSVDDIHTYVYKWYGVYVEGNKIKKERNSTPL